MEARLMGEELHIYNQLTETSFDGIFVQKFDEIIFVNKRLCEMLESKKEDLMGIKHWRIYHPDYQELTRKRAAARIRGENVPERYEVKLQSKNGKSFWAEIIARAIKLKGEPGICVWLRDISERKKLEKEKARLESQLNQIQRIEALAVLAGGIAHDFNNLLHSMEGYISLIKLTDSEQKREEYIDKIFKIISRGTTLARQLLIFGRKVERKKELIKLNSLIDDVLNIIRATTPRTVEIDKQLNGEVVLYADRHQLEQVLINILMNAVDAVKGHGKISIKTRMVKLEETEKERWGVEGDLCVKIQINDNGIGIPSEIKDRIFEPFFTTKEMGRGTGLGLSTAYAIVKAHKGHIDVISEQNKGASFNIYIPPYGTYHRGNDVTEDVTGKDDDRKDISGKTILIVDDELSILETFGIALKNMGCYVFSASKGDDAIRIYRKKYREIDLVIMDIDMPVMNGISCLNEMKKINPQIKFLISTGYGDTIKPDSQNFDILSKPYSIDELRDQIYRICNR